MMIALYRIDTKGRGQYYYLHDYQGNLFSPYSFTTVWGKEMAKGREKLYTFQTRFEMDAKLKDLFGVKVAEGYKVLYAYPHQNFYQHLFSHLSREQAS
ncbi:MAG: WGR domain-containing protein [Spirochaetales bacterium]|nr:WGR domain-containing protein [Spirochaetales bacterium]